jgi:uncharacterized OB-fold protein
VVFAETMVHVAPDPFEGSYQVALISLGGARVMARVEDDIAIDDAVALSGIIEVDDYPAPLFEPTD